MQRDEISKCSILAINEVFEDVKTEGVVIIFVRLLARND
jgi:hypothetical protein